MEKKITVENFIKEYKSFNKDRVQESAIKKHVWRNKYVPYEEKCAVCSGIVKASMTAKVNDRDVFKQDTAAQYMLYTLNLINLYTDITINFSNGLAEFNMLEKEGITTLLLHELPAEEKMKMETILKMKLDDFYENERSFLGFIGNLADKYRSIFNKFSDKLVEVIENEESKELRDILKRKITNKK